MTRGIPLSVIGVSLQQFHYESDYVYVCLITLGFMCIGRLYALQTALSIDKKSDEAKLFLLPLMEWLENEKRSSTSAELINSDTVAQAYVENYALKLFTWADNMDRAGTFNKYVNFY